MFRAIVSLRGGFVKKRVHRQTGSPFWTFDKFAASSLASLDPAFSQHANRRLVTLFLPGRVPLCRYFPCVERKRDRNDAVRNEHAEIFADLRAAEELLSGNWQNVKQQVEQQQVSALQ